MTTVFDTNKPSISKYDAARCLADSLERVRILEDRIRAANRDLDTAKRQLENDMQNFRIAHRDF